MANYIGPSTNGPRRLREMLEAGDPVLAPGVYDALGARLVEEAGFEAVYMTGFGTAASMLGRPDVGLLTMSEMVDNARRIARACALPVIADADTGFGNAINVVRTVQEYEQAGVAALHIEDQVAPKRCGHMEGKQVVPTDEMVTKIRAAVSARESPDLVIIARTDARAVEGLPAAIERARSLPGRGRRRPLRRGGDERGRDRDRRVRAGRRTPAVQLGRRRQDAPDPVRPARSARLRHRHLPDQHPADGDGVDPPGVGRDGGRPHADPDHGPHPSVRRVPGLHRPARDG